MIEARQIDDFGRPASDFALPGVDGRTWRLGDVRGPQGTLVMFLCNHCPYVKHVIERVVAETEVMRRHAIGAVAIMSNDTAAYPEDSFDNMKRFAAEHKFGFPYLLDEAQDVARAYGAVSTPEFFGFDGGLRLRYRGRFDDSGMKGAPSRHRELLEAMLQIAATGQGPATVAPALGCSIKWRRG